ncbi:hypothetical protein BDR26DRAFT_868345 [Obelidium mucronatum]|nr:hypothetical protein BDR26DRAFT_868345 [Obelidium mucronatum]
MSVPTMSDSPAAGTKLIPRQSQYDHDLEQTPEPEVSSSPGDDALPPPPPPPLGRTIFFALEESMNLLSAIKCTVDHVALFPSDRFVLLAVVDSECERELTLSRTSTLLRSLNQKSQFILQVLVAPSTSTASLICKLVNEARPDLLILGLSGDSFLGQISSHCIVNARCRVIIKRLTYSVEVAVDEADEVTIYRESL